MFSRKHRCVFIHIPKTAGQSIETVFLNDCGLDWESRGALLLGPNENPARGPARLAHLTAAEYVARGHLTQQEYDACFTFAFVRNPWERLVSEYSYRPEYARLSFREFVLESLPARDAFSDFYRHIMPQCEFLLGADGQQIVDFVGRFEHLARDFETVRERVGLPPGPLPRVNDSRKAKSGSGMLGVLRRLPGLAPPPRRPWPTFYDEDTKRAVGEMYAADCEAFGYRFDE